jgi:hypothetical protein
MQQFNNKTQEQATTKTRQQVRQCKKQAEQMFQKSGIQNLHLFGKDKIYSLKTTGDLPEITHPQTPYPNQGLLMTLCKKTSAPSSRKKSGRFRIFTRFLPGMSNETRYFPPEQPELSRLYRLYSVGLPAVITLAKKSEFAHRKKGKNAQESF